jgi:NAD(P)-dependent dehydrogenase (short-subunit alcohol dehydrogenase family)
MKNNKVWFITGATSGFGKAFCEYAVSKGYNVFATGRNTEKLKMISEINPQLVKTSFLDVTDTTSISEAIKQAYEVFGKIDVLFNNAGYGIVGAVEETPEIELRKQMETNFFGAFNVSKAVIPLMRKAQQGAIVNISSLGGQLSFGGFGAYSASKFALEGLSEAMAQELAPFNIKVLIVEPGAFRTDFAGDALLHMEKMNEYENIIGGTREFAKGMHQTQAGNPFIAAKVIDEVLNDANTPLRLQLGNDAVDSVKQHSIQLLNDLEKWELIGRNVNF